jgi:hypothetical protein
VKQRAAFLFGSLAFCWLFFAEYLSPFRRVHIPYDLEGYHYPLVDYAFQSLRQGRFPQWDWSSYSGMTFVGNLQAALFYPPTWLLFLANAGREHVSYQSLQTFELAHVWLGSVLCFCWLRRRGLGNFACVAGAQVFAYSGYMCLQLQHQGLVTAFAWFPMAAWGIDEAAESRTLRPLWKLTLASALCFLTGYPPMWIVFAVSMVAYAVGRLQVRVALGTLLALVGSLLLAMVQIVPAWEAARIMETTVNYGAGFHEPRFFLSYLLPNYFNFGLDVPVLTNPGMEYLYLGAPGLIGLLLVIRFKQLRVALPAFLLMLAAGILLINPLGMVWAVIQHSALLATLFRAWYFLAGLAFAAALMAAVGIDAFLRRTGGFARGLRVVIPAAMLAWSCWELWRWFHQGFPSGPESAWITVVTLALFAAGLYCMRGAKGREGLILVAVLVLFSGVDYKVFGTSKRFNASVQPSPSFRSDRFPNMDPQAYQEIRAHTQYRVLLDETAPFPTIVRHWEARTPQGFDPLMTGPYRALLGTSAQFQTDRLFRIDPADEAELRLLGVRYFVTGDSGRFYAFVSHSPKFRLLGSADPYYKTFEYVDAVPAFSAEPGDAMVDVVTWNPEHRGFRVNSASGGRLNLSEQFLAGWSAVIDGRPSTLEPWRGAFQSVAVPQGVHVVEFRFSSPGLLLGAFVSLLSLGALMWVAWGGHVRS